MEQSVRLPDGAAVTGWSGCRLHRANFFDGLATDGTTQLPVPLALGRKAQIRRDESVVLSRDPLEPAEVVLRYGISCTRELRSLFDAARDAPDLREAVVAIDMMAAAELVSIGQLAGHVATHRGWRGVDQVRRALPLASEHSRSPNESRMRLIWQLDAGLPRPLVNQHVFDNRGRLLGIADLLDPVAGVVGEYDGADHRAAVRHSNDVAREDGFRSSGLEYFKVVGPDMHDHPLIVARMESARGRALWLSKDDQAWTLEPPPGWERAWTLDEKLEHRALMAAIYAEYEREGDPDIADIIGM